MRRVTFVVALLNLLTAYLNGNSEFFKEHKNKEVVELYDRCKDLAQWARTTGSLKALD